MTLKSRLLSTPEFISNAWHRLKQKLKWVKELPGWIKKLPRWTIERLRGNRTELPWRARTPGGKVAEKDFKNNLFFPPDWFIYIPNQLKSYDSWKEHLKGKHSSFKSSLPGDKKSQDKFAINLTLLREYYKIQIGLYEKYLNLLIRFNFLNFAITGAILSFTLRSPERDFIRWSFIFPFFMNVFFALLILLAFRSLKTINREITYMSELLGFQPPGVRTLRHALAVSFFTLLLLALVLFPTAFNVCALQMYHVNVNWILSNRPSPTGPTYPCNTREDDIAARQKEQAASPR